MTSVSDPCGSVSFKTAGSVSMKRTWNRIRPDKKPAENHRKNNKLHKLDYFLPQISYIGALQKLHNNRLWVIRGKNFFLNFLIF